MAFDYQAALSEYGAIATFAQSNPEVNEKLQEAIAGEWDAARFQRELWTTNWYKTYSDNQQQLQIQQATDPGTYNANLSLKAQHVQDMADSLGITVDKWAIAQQALWYGWDDNTIQKSIGTTGSVMHGYSGAAYGQVGDFVNHLKNTYESYGLSMGDQFYESQARMIAAGKQTTGGATNEAIAYASKLFPQYAQDFTEGRTLSDIATPFIQQMAQTLEVDPSAITLKDKTITQALQGDGKTPMTMYQFQQALKADPRWQKTDNAKNAAYDVVSQIGKDWGFA